ncbi:MAG: hypothetical protein E7231_09760 [Cellulosilyticum sp.]|nr:hypothetical protein [Cellulosilyticum sp.]
MRNDELMRRLDEVIVTDATDTSPASFLATHIPFKNLSYTDSGIGEGIEKAISEDEFLNEYMQQRGDKHQLIIVEGHSGSGKSHFIRWLLEHYRRDEDTNEVVIPIHRHQNTLKGALSQILESGAFEGEEYRALTRKLVGAKEQLEDDELIYTIKNSFLTKLEVKKDFEDCELSQRENTKLIEFLKHTYTFEHLFGKEGGPLRRLEKKISSSNDEGMQEELDARFRKEDFDIDIKFKQELKNSEANTKANDFARALGDDKDGIRERVATYLNEMVDGVVQLCTNLNGQDFTEIFYELRKALKKENKTLTLFIEDITSFTGIDKALLEALLVDHQSRPEICKVNSIVGITESYYKNHIPRNIKQRVTGRLVISERSVFESDNDLLTMAARYLNAIKQPKETLEKWVKEGALLANLPISTLDQEHKWSLYQDGLLGEISLFPFNQRAIIGLYETLDEKTPRVFLKQIIKHVYARYLKAPDNFPGSWKSFENYYHIPKWQNIVHENMVAKQAGDKAEEVSCVLRVWGDRTVGRKKIDGVEYVGGLPEKAFVTFHIPFIRGEEQADTHHTLPPTSPDEIQGQSEKALQINGKKEELKVTLTPPDKIEPKVAEAPVPITTNKYELEMQVLNEWFNEGKQLVSHKTLRADIAGFLYNFIDWQAEGVSSYLVEQFFGKTSQRSIAKISIEGQPVEINANGIVFKRNREDFEFIQALIAYKHLGEGSWYFSEASYYLVSVYDWINSNKARLIELISGEKECAQNLRWAIYNQYILLSINGEIDGDESIEEIYYKVIDADSKLMKHKCISKDSRHSNKWNEYVSSINSDAIESNYALLINSNKIIQGTAVLENAPIFLDAIKIIQEIQYLMQHHWELEAIELRYATRDSAYASYHLLRKLQGIIPKLIKEETMLCTEQVKQIKKYIKTEQIEHSLVRMKNFLNDVMFIKARARFSYEKFALLQQDEVIINENAKMILESVRFTEALQKNTSKCIIELSKTSTTILYQYLEMLKGIDELMDREINKNQEAISQNNLSKEKVEENEKIIKKWVAHIKHNIAALRKEE